MKRTDSIISHWHTLIDNFNTSGQDFYRAVEASVRERQIPDVTFSRFNFKEGGLASSKREYLRIERKFVAFDVCAAPYGNGYFFSWWLARLGPKHPIVDLLLFLSFMIIGSLAIIFTLKQISGFLFFFFWFTAPIIVLFILGLMAQQHVFGPEENILMIPFIGWLYEKIFNPVTYYSLDTALMFQESIRRAVNESIEAVMSEQGLQALAEEDLLPTMRTLVD